MGDDDIVGDLGLADPDGPVRPKRRLLDMSPEAAQQRRLESAAARLAVPKPRRRRTAEAAASASLPSEDAVAIQFVERHAGEYLHVGPWHRWMRWDGMRWREDATGRVYEAIRRLVREQVEGGKAERSTACAAFVGGVERLLRHDQSLAAMPEDFDADPWLLNTPSGIVDLITGETRAHDADVMCTKLAGASLDPGQAAAQWAQFLDDITRGDSEMRDYLQRVAGYCATGVTTEDMLVFIFGVGSNGKNTFAEAIEHALGDYAKVFGAEVLMEARGERHPAELAQFLGIRFGLTSEPGANATWNDSRIKSLTGDATINARFMRGDPFTFRRTHKTMIIGNHAPRLGDVSHAMRRRLQVVPFHAVFAPTPGENLRERLKAECAGAILAWIVEGARLWRERGTAPPEVVRELTADYLGEQDVFGQWLAECCERSARDSERSSTLHRNYAAWCEGGGLKPDSVVRFSASLVACGFRKRVTSVGKLFDGLRLKIQSEGSQ